MNTKMECELQSELCQLTMLIIILTLHIKKNSQIQFHPLILTLSLHIQIYLTNTTNNPKH